MRIVNNPDLDNQIINKQQVFHQYFDKHYTFNKSLWFAIISGATFSFVGSHCYGSIEIDSVLAVLVTAVLGFSSLQVVLFIKLPMIRLIKFGTVVLSSFLLSKETFALYSEKILEVENACRPYLYTDDPIGYMWIIIPMLAIIAWCFSGNEEFKLSEYLKSTVPEVYPSPKTKISFPKFRKKGTS